MKLNLGCGRDYRSGWKNVDISRETKADDYYDLRKGINESDNSVDEIYCAGVLEQILGNEEFVFVMNEMYRVLTSAGTVTIQVPSARKKIAFRDPFDCRYFIEETWDYLRYSSKYYDRYGKLYGFKPWRLLERKTNFNSIMTVILQPKKQ